ncbi:MAG: hypothetical protein AAGG38_14645, partial [Planctomycetota bacterium]
MFISTGCDITRSDRRVSSAACRRVLIVAVGLSIAASAAVVFGQAGGTGADAETGAEPPTKGCHNSGSGPNPDNPSPCPVGANQDKCEDDKKCGKGSSVDPLGMIYMHFAYDYLTKVPGGGGKTGCLSCGQVGANHTGPGSIGELPRLNVTRVYKPRFTNGLRAARGFGEHSMLGYGVVVLIYPDSGRGDGVTMRYFDPTGSAQQVRVSDGDAGGLGDGRLGARSTSILEVRAFDAAWTVAGDTFTNTGALTSNPDQMRAVEVEFRDGRRWCFEVFAYENPVTNDERAARILRQEDRNGNGVTLTYAYPVDAPDLNPGFDRRLLWQFDEARDAYGHTVTFTYGSVVNGYLPIRRVDLPNGTSVDYGYDSRGRLVTADHPDGSVTTFAYRSHPTDPNLNEVEIFDPAAEAGHRRKTLAMTKSHWSDGTTVTNTPKDRLVSVTNGAGELSYANWERGATGSRSLVYVYWGGNYIERTDQRLGYLLEESYASALVLDAQGRIDVSATQWQITKKAAGHTGRMSTTTQDALDRATVRPPDTARRIYPQTTYPDQTTRQRSYTPTYNWLSSETDRLGRTTDYTRDSRGNVLTKTVAVGTPAEATEAWTYNNLGQCLTYTDANGNVTEYFYSTTGDPGDLDGSGYLVKVVEPADTPGGDRAAFLYTYDTSAAVSGGGKLVASTDPTGRVVAYGYDLRGRLTQVTFFDGSTQQFIYGAPGSGDENLLVETIDRNGNREVCAFDGADRETLCTEAFGTAAAVTTATTYLTGTTKVLTRTRHGQSTSYAYDGRNRVVSTTAKADGATPLTSTTVYDAGQRVRQTTDPYGRSTYIAYDINDRRARTVTETVAGSVTLPHDDTTVAGTQDNDLYLRGLARILDANAVYLVSDYVYDAEGQLVSTTDPRNVQARFEYDPQGRRTRVIEAFGTASAATTETLYDPQGNVVEVRRPRYFAPTSGPDADPHGSGKARVVMTYTGRNLLASRTDTPGTPEEATESYTYFLDRRLDTTTDARGHAWSKLWGTCCARIMATIDPAADVDADPATPGTRAATITRHDAHGNLTHTGRVADLDAVVFPGVPTPGLPQAGTDLPDADTLRETTTRYDARHRPIATTTWLVPLPEVDPNHVPIAGGGLPGDPAVTSGGVTQGLTTTYTYDDDLTDGVGLDASGSYGPQLAAQLPAGFYAAGSDGYAVAMTNPEGETSVRFVDGLGRTVLTVDPEGDASSVDYDTLTFVADAFHGGAAGGGSGG